MSKEAIAEIVSKFKMLPWDLESDPDTIQGNKEAMTVEQWIPIEQELPPYYVWVLCIERTSHCINPYCRYRIANRGGHGLNPYNILAGEAIDITHWMHLPDPPIGLDPTVGARVGGPSVELRGRRGTRNNDRVPENRLFDIYAA